MTTDMRKIILNISILLTIGFYVAASFYPLESLWGFNHLHYLPVYYWIISAFIFLFVIVILFTKFKFDFEKLSGQIDRFFWGTNHYKRVLFVCICTLMFYLFRVETFLLGDGYTLLSTFGQGESFIHKWSQPGSILLIRFVQRVLGGYSEQTATLAFQILSFLSGGLFLYYVIAVIEILTENVIKRLLLLATLFFSGSLLLYFGYVEFYAMSWACAAMFVFYSLKSLSEKKYIWFSVFVFLIMILVHIQAIYFIGGLCYILLYHIKSPILKKTGVMLFALAASAGVFLLIWLYHTKIEFEVLILPLLQGRPVAPHFTIFSVPHLIEICNLVLLIAPGSFILVGLSVFAGKFRKLQSQNLFLLYTSLGSLLFLVLYGAAITMGRDWDIMSLTCFTPLLLICSQFDSGILQKYLKPVIAYILVTMIISASFISVGVSKEATEKRFYRLLNENNRSGWVIYANYFLSEGNEAKYQSILNEMNELFPEYIELQRGYSYLEQGRIQSAKEIAESLVTKDNYQPDFHQLLANVFEAEGNYTMADSHFQIAHSLHPYQSTLKNEIGQLYLKQKRYAEAILILQEARSLSPDKTFIGESLALAYIYQQDYTSASAIADTLFMRDSNSPGAHLIKMVIALNLGDRVNAQRHFREYIKYGSSRSDYRRNLQYYKNLLSEEN